MTRVVVHIRRLSLHGAGAFSAERFQERLAAELQQRLGGDAIATEPSNQEQRAASRVAARVGAAAPELTVPGSQSGRRSP